MSDHHVLVAGGYILYTQRFLRPLAETQACRVEQGRIHAPRPPP
jgi:hypothetical protein